MRVPCLIPLALAATLISCTSEKVEPPHTYLMGERARVGHMSYTVFERQWHTQFGTGPDARMPQNRFYLLRLSVLNSGGAEAILPALSLVDDAGNAIPEATDGDGVQDWIGNTREIAPAETAQGFLLFDVPPKHYKLKVQGDDEKQIAFVDIPLSFDSDVPESPVDLDKLPIKK